MAYPTTFSWPITAPTASAPPNVPNPGPPVPGSQTSKDIRKQQFERGIKWANVPGGRADNLIHGGARVYHVNSVVNVTQETSDKTGNSGVVVFRHRKRYAATPNRILHIEVRVSDRFSNPVFPFTGQYAPGTHLANIDNGFWNVQSIVPFARNCYMGDIFSLLYASGSIWVAGGLSNSQAPLSSAITFNTGTNAWAVLPDMPGPKSEGAGCTLSNGDILVQGGSGSVASELTASYRFLTASNAWQVIPGTICQRKDHQIIRLFTPANGFVFAPGGTGLSGSGLLPFTGSELFNPNTNLWYANQVSGTSGYMPPIPIYPYNREGYTLTTIPNGSGSCVLIGGRDPLTGESNSNVLLFTPPNVTLPGSQGTWRIEPSMSFVRADHQAIALDDGRVMILGGNGGRTANLKSLLPMYMGGQYGSLSAISEVEIYDYRDHTVTSIGQMRDARANFAAALLSHDSAEGRIVVAGGNNIDTFLSGVEICDVESFSWQRVTSLQVPVAQHKMFQISSGTSAPYRFVVPSGLLTGSTSNHTSSQVFQTNG